MHAALGTVQDLKPGLTNTIFNSWTSIYYSLSHIIFALLILLGLNHCGHADTSFISSNNNDATQSKYNT